MLEILQTFFTEQHFQIHTTYSAFTSSSYRRASPPFRPPKIKNIVNPYIMKRALGAQNMS
jgi:hypothetical protein